MTSLILNQQVEVACEAVETAAKLCENVRSEMTALQAMTKSDKSPVTIADYGSQAIICKMLRDVFPDDPVVAEEDANDLLLPANKDQLERVTSYVTAVLDDSVGISEEDVPKLIDHGNGAPSNQRFWTLDPIDGTKGFLRGDQYAICLALIENGSVKIGIIACPALELGDDSSGGSVTGHLFLAIKGEGAWRKPLYTKKDATLTRVQVSQEVDSLVQSFEASHGNHSSQQAVAKAVGIESLILMDSQAKYCIVATGKAALYLRLSSCAENIWDHAAGAILVEEAGGKVSDSNGKSLIFTAPKMTESKGVVVTNGFLHDEVLSSLKEFLIL
jgi:3'(2'), 5'-bisphosphate nucleotidase